MVQAVNLPPRKTPYDHPVIIRGQEFTKDQEQQAQLAQIAGIITATAAAKASIEQAVTNQLIVFLRSADLTTEVGIKAFATAAATLVEAGIRQARLLSWSGVAARAKVAGVQSPPVMPVIDSFSPETRYSRKTDLETAYARIAKEYQESLKKSSEDKVIKDLIEEFEAQNLTPLPRAEALSSDVVRTTLEQEPEWKREFRKAEEAVETPSRTNTAREIPKERAKPPAPREEAPGGQGRGANQLVSPTRRPDYEPAPARPDEEAGEPSERLVSEEIQEIIERYAQRKAEERAERMVSQDITATIRNTQKEAVSRMDKKTVIGFRRVVHPELSESGQSCGLCIVASTMTYTRGDLLPIHSGCNCGIAEIYSIDSVVFDPGAQINSSDLEVFYREAGNSTHGWDLKRQRYKIIDHPEFGPTLVNDTTKKSRAQAEAVEFEGREEEA